MPIIIRNPSLSVEEIFAEPDFKYNETSGKVPVLAITVAYEAMITGMHTLMPPGLSFRERVQLKGTKVIPALRFDFLPVIRGQGDQTFPREHTRLVEKKLIYHHRRRARPTAFGMDEHRLHPRRPVSIHRRGGADRQRRVLDTGSIVWADVAGQGWLSKHGEGRRMLPVTHRPAYAPGADVHRPGIASR
jgi:hypothetical protein